MRQVQSAIILARLSAETTDRLCRCNQGNPDRPAGDGLERLWPS